ncbi:MAG: bifunctional glutamate N-acetyltransferase/amino-acid acetyltransferase ArgJ [Lentisphaerae bacterium]|nr:bifunctional glutamate N-acetyltransferase/amino-acid acetyltransferase ArgJ [Lentisphaerota bacterium]
MSIRPIEQGGVTSAAGFQAAGIIAGLKRSGAKDMAMLYSPRPCVAVGAFTSNLFAAAPVIYDRKLIAADTPIHAIVINSGNANACTGQQGLQDAEKTAAHAAAQLCLHPTQVLVSSTGRIGVPMPMNIILAGVDKAVKALSADGGQDAAAAIMTTDTRPKSHAVAVDVGGATVRIGGMTKGAGMIAPKLRMQPLQATMLAYITTDAAIERQALHDSLARALDLSFNRITVDGDTSTNDTVIALANGAAGNDLIKAGTPEAETFFKALVEVLARLAREMVLDGEGVTRFVEINVCGAKNDADARRCAEAIANSALCKTAWFGADPNWGRILCAAGYSGCEFDPSKVNLDYMSTPVVRRGMDAGTPEAELAEIVKAKELSINLDLGDGPGAFTVWSCDMTYEYVKINADYHT